MNTVNTFLTDETGVLNPWSDGSRQTKILTILDDPQEVKKGRQKELNSLKDMGVMTTSRWQTSDTDAMVRSRERRLREILIGSEGPPS